MKNCVFESDWVVVKQADFCAVPGYLVVTLTNGAESLADLSEETSQQLGALLSKTAAAIEQATAADRVYCLSFCEQLRTLHFHLLPRTSQLLTDYQQATNCADQAINGALLFEWARDNYPAGAAMPSAYGELVLVCEKLRAALQSLS